MTEGKLLPFRRVEGTPAELSDRALVSALGEGDQAALGALYDRFHRDVHRFVARLAREAEVWDVVQSTFLAAHRAAKRFRGDSSVKTWLFAIAANLVRQQYRGEARRHRATELVAAVPLAASPAPSEQLVRDQQQRWLAAAIERLTPALREAYVLCVIEEIPGKDAARALAIREASLWRRLSDAREALRATIGELERGGAR
ncbi:MAG: RNA polymerase sigma factor [Kofleriaceae bacterium]